MAYIVMAYMVIAFVVMAHRETLDSFVALGIRLHVCCMCDAFTLHIDVACLTFFQIKGVNDVYATSPPQICTCGLATCLCQLLVTCICQLWMLSADSHVPLPALLCANILLGWHLSLPGCTCRSAYVETQSILGRASFVSCSGIQICRTLTFSSVPHQCHTASCSCHSTKPS